MQVRVIVHLGDEARAGQVTGGMLQPRGEREHGATKPRLVPRHAANSEQIAVPPHLLLELHLQLCGSVRRAHDERAGHGSLRKRGQIEPRTAQHGAALVVLRRRDDAHGEEGRAIVAVQHRRPSL